MLCSADLSFADLSLAERDRYLPGLATLLDDAAMLRLLRSAGQEVQALTSRYVRYKPYTNCLVAYEVIVQGQPQWVYGKVFAPERTDKLRKYRRMGNGSQGLSALRPIVQADLGLAIAPFPYDRLLTTLEPLIDPRTQGDVLKSLLPNPFDSPITLKTLNYKPERRYVAQVSLGADPAQRWVFKAYTQPDYDTACRNSRDVQARDVLQTVPPVGYSPPYRILAFPWVSDSPLVEQLQATPAAVLNTLIPVGTALAELHGQRLKRLPQVGSAAEALDMMAMVSDLCHLHPVLAGKIKTLSRTIAEGLIQLPQQWCSTHGDFKPDQVLLQGRAVTLLDFDRAAVAHPARDLGSFLAQLEYQILRGTLDDGCRTAAAQGLLIGYTAQEEVPAPESIQLYKALHLFKRLPEPFRYRVPNWPTCMEKMLHRIEAILRDGE